ncbi:NAD(P)-dependent alcohol dehydrogenase [Halarcobacter mediterraneus]|uniref:NAD(P)-dependent alcohol dehydrogenase n=1 Tax=Halarcobacter mediterraneus TaxID=2023153 RepID=A0A4Q1B236_9BACT|nr:NAD(P)-dependent alcohol dehydrogenase [Halarcobacter mediterraneus]RXK14431.1 NAD(P)-dependent alcohol dehydrogenase [Halarcobacter mediterraneus]|eukprot:gnl/Chilomastix_cuspidata/8345.p1 GENE.gnl/Chilomastix_cuspidata/8345~~gnl/Chilomastix_cuspidata/8345.p1  ORF type:complete len:350 (-),score=-46.50 gnl/Chilomastix_cuspidata/8345:277-1326(-)
MKGFAMMSIGQVGWVDKERPNCGPMDAICRPIALAPCTSDVHTVWAGALGDRHELILGHESVGEIVEVGSLVKDFKVGDKVLIPAITPDWNSLAAQGGYSMHSGGLLSGWKFSNFKDGVFAEFFHVNDADGNLALLPQGMDLASACMLADMVPTGVHGVELADIQFGDKVVVIGIGPVGLMAVAAASIRGASEIYAVGSRPNCVALAKEFGASEIINYHDGDIAEQILEKVGLVDRVIIAGGTVDTFAQAIKILKPGGKIGNVNYLGKGDSVNIPRVEWGFGMSHKSIVGGLMPGGRLRMEKLASLVTSGRLNPGKLVTHTFKGLESVEEALLLMKDKPKDLIKPLILL